MTEQELINNFEAAADAWLKARLAIDITPESLMFNDDGTVKQRWSKKKKKMVDEQRWGTWQNYSVMVQRLCKAEMEAFDKACAALKEYRKNKK